MRPTTRTRRFKPIRRKTSLIRRPYRRATSPKRLRRSGSYIRLPGKQKRKKRLSRPYWLGRLPYYKPRPVGKRTIIVRDSTLPPLVVNRTYSRLSTGAREALRSHNLYTTYWRKRFSDAPARIIRFIENYHQVSGFQHVIRAFFGSFYGRQQVTALLLLLKDLARRDNRLNLRIRFRQESKIDDDGNRVRIAALHYRGRVYRALPSYRV